MTQAKIICDSLGHTRLTTFEIEFPRFLQAELNTHKQLAKNSASSRAIPVEKQLERVRNDPFVPQWWGANQKGMQASVALTDTGFAKDVWIQARNECIRATGSLQGAGLHKQYANRLLELWSYQKVIITGDADSWANFFNLRVSEHAQPEFDELAGLMLQAYVASEPFKLEVGEWHLPYQGPPHDPINPCVTVVHGHPLEWNEGHTNVPRHPFVTSAAACARVSYRSEKVTTLEEDQTLVHRLIEGGHWSPFEHQAQVMPDNWLSFDEEKGWEPFTPRTDGPWSGWKQLRKFFPGENRTKLDPAMLLHKWQQRREARGLA